MGILKILHDSLKGLNGLVPAPHALVQFPNFISGFSAGFLIRPEVFQHFVIGEHSQGIFLRDA